MGEIKSAGDIIAVAQAEISCLDVDSAWNLFQQSVDAKDLEPKNTDPIIIDVRESESAANSKLEQFYKYFKGFTGDAGSQTGT